MIDGGVIYGAVKAAGLSHKGLKALDAYAAKHNISRGEALEALRREAAQRGDAGMRDFAGRWAHAWAEEADYAAQHPVRAAVRRAVIPGGVLGRVTITAVLAKRPGQ